MSNEAVVALDVGGTDTDAACVSASGDVIGELLEFGSFASGTKDEIVTALAHAIEAARAVARAAGFTVTACGIAIPAPFDYAAGIPYMRHKFRAVYGVELGPLLRSKTGLPVHFVNDAAAFGLGVGWRQLPEANRFVALTIGTGLGAGFIENGEIVDDDDRVPPAGQVWDLPYEDGILEDYVSARAVTTRYGKLSRGERRSARDVSNLALQGSEPAIEAYRAMGSALGRGLAPVLARFGPEVVVIGGKVAQSLELFRPAMEQALASAGLPSLRVLPAASENMAILGAARYPLTHGSKA
jgi:predicted NBD/HSP70 family sugar kinase